MARNFLFDWVAPFYDRLLRPANSDRLRHLLQLPIEGLLLDAAGGTGRASTQFCSQVGALVINDLSAAMLQQAAGKCVHGVICSPVERLPFAAGRFERIMVVDALHHFSAQRSGLSELLRVLSPGGRLVIEEPDIERFSVKLIALAEKLALMQSHFLPPEQIRAQLEQLGYPAQIERDGWIAWVIVDK